MSAKLGGRNENTMGHFASFAEFLSIGLSIQWSASIFDGDFRGSSGLPLDFRCRSHLDLLQDTYESARLRIDVSGKSRFIAQVLLLASFVDNPVVTG